MSICSSLTHLMKDFKGGLALRKEGAWREREREGISLFSLLPLEHE